MILQRLKNKVKWLGCGFGLCCVMMAHAMNSASMNLASMSTASLYQVQIPVATQATTVSSKLLKTALKNVLIRISGNMTVAQVSAVKSALSSPNDYVRSFDYVSAPPHSTQLFLLQVSFTPALIRQLLQQANQPVWIENRPSTLVWLVVRDAKGMTVMNGDTSNPAVLVFNQVEKLRGIPIAYPAMDLIDQKQVDLNALWEPDLQRIRSSSARYPSDDILVGCIDATHKTAVTSRWYLLMKSGNLQWEADENNLETVVRDGAMALADTLVQRFAQVTHVAQPNQVKLVVAQLQGVADYAKVARYLRGLSGVNHVSIEDIQPSQATFSLKLDTDIATFTQAVRLSQVLLPLQQTGQAGGASQQSAAQDSTSPASIQTLEYVYNRSL